MPIFKISGTKLKKLNSLPLDKEKNLQALVEANLIEVLDLLFLATEYTTTENTTATSAIKVTSPSRLCSSLRLSCHTFLNQRPMPSPRKCACGVVLC